MREKIRKNEIVYDYEIHKFSQDVRLAIILYIFAVIFFIVSVLVSYLFLGNAPSIVAGIGICSLILNIASMTLIVIEIYLQDNYHSEIRTMLLLQLILFSVWFLIIR